MNCPNCIEPATPAHLRDSPECAAAVQSLAAIYRASKRTTPPKAGPGRPKGSKDSKPRKSAGKVAVLRATATYGAPTYLDLACGHQVKRFPSAPIPKQTACEECASIARGEVKQDLVLKPEPWKVREQKNQQKVASVMDKLMREG